MNIAVIGGGISGLTAGYRLSQAGARVTLFETSDRLGGITTFFEYEGMRLDAFYHCILDSDTYLVRLLKDLDLTGNLRWAKTRMAFFVDGKKYPFNSAVDLLRFKALSLPNRIRTGMAALYITKFCKDGIPLDDVLAHEWLRKLFGQKVYRAIWEPLLTAKFGDLRETVPAYWIWNTLNREKNGSEEVKGYLRGGYPLIMDHLRDGIEANGGAVCLNSPVEVLQADEAGVRLRVPGGWQDFDAAVATLPLGPLQKIAAHGLREQIPLPNLNYQGVVNVLVVRREPLDEYYWTAVVNSDFPFQGVVQTDHVIPPEWIGGRHIIYAMNYCSQESPLYAVSDEMAQLQAVQGLQRLYPGFSPASVESVHVFRTPYVEPVWTLGYLRKRPSHQIGGTRLFLANTAQAYPMVTSWNTSIKFTEDAVSSLFTAARAGGWARDLHETPVLAGTPR